MLASVRRRRLKPLKRWIKALLGRAGYLLVNKREQVEHYLIDGLYTFIM